MYGISIVDFEDPRRSALLESATPVYWQEKNVKSKNKGNSEVQKRLLEQKRIAEKLRRQKIRNEPETYENYCQKERARNKEKKIEGKRKSIEQLSDQEKRARRKQQKRIIKR